MEPQIEHAHTQDALIGESALMGLEWHAFLAFDKWRSRLVGRVETVDREEITLTRLDPDAGGGEDAEVCVQWRDVDCIAVCGPDRDQDLFDLLHDETHG